MGLRQKKIQRTQRKTVPSVMDGRLLVGNSTRDTPVKNVVGTLTKKTKAGRGGRGRSWRGTRRKPQQSAGQQKPGGFTEGQKMKMGGRAVHKPQEHQQTVSQPAAGCKKKGGLKKKTSRGQRPIPFNRTPHQISLSLLGAPTDVFLCLEIK